MWHSFDTVTGGGKRVGRYVPISLVPQFEVLVRSSAVYLTFTDDVARVGAMFIYHRHGWSCICKDGVFGVPETISAGHIDFCVCSSIQIAKRYVSGAFDGSKMGERFDIGVVLHVVVRRDYSSCGVWDV